MSQVSLQMASVIPPCSIVEALARMEHDVPSETV